MKDDQINSVGFKYAGFVLLGILRVIAGAVWGGALGIGVGIGALWGLIWAGIISVFLILLKRNIPAHSHRAWVATVIGAYLGTMRVIWALGIVIVVGGIAWIIRVFI